MKEFSIDSFRIKDLLQSILPVAVDIMHRIAPPTVECARGFEELCLSHWSILVHICVNGSRELYPSKNKRKKMDRNKLHYCTSAVRSLT